MPRLIRAIVVTLLVAAIAAGCTFPRESTYAAKTRDFTADVPDGTTQLAVSVSAQAMAGHPDITVSVKDTNGTVIASAKPALGNATAMLVANLTGQTHLVVQLVVASGDAGVGLVGTAIAPAQPNTVVLQEDLVLQG